MREASYGAQRDREHQDRLQGRGEGHIGREVAGRGRITPGSTGVKGTLKIAAGTTRNGGIEVEASAAEPPFSVVRSSRRQTSCRRSFGFCPRDREFPRLFRAAPGTGREDIQRGVVEAGDFGD